MLAIVLLCGICSAIPFVDSGDALFGYFTASFLIDKVHTRQYHSSADIMEIDSLKIEIRNLAEKLETEQLILREFLEKRQTVKRNNGRLIWFFKKESRLHVQLLSMEIHDQRRKIAYLKENMEFKWSQLKPFFGVFSDMFLVDFLSIVPFIIVFITESIQILLEMGMISLLLGGPVLLLLSMALVSLFGTMVSIVFRVPVLIALLVWILNLPFLIIQYSPSPLQFLSVHIPATIALLYIAYALIKSLRAPSPPITHLKFE